jgi:hypothetical protein
MRNLILGQLFAEKTASSPFEGGHNGSEMEDNTMEQATA